MTIRASYDPVPRDLDDLGPLAGLEPQPIATMPREAPFWAVDLAGAPDAPFIGTARPGCSEAVDRLAGGDAGATHWYREASPQEVFAEARRGVDRAVRAAYEHAAALVEAYSYGDDDFEEAARGIRRLAPGAESAA